MKQLVHVIPITPEEFYQLSLAPFRQLKTPLLPRLVNTMIDGSFVEERLAQETRQFLMAVRRDGRYHDLLLVNWTLTPRAVTAWYSCHDRVILLPDKSKEGG